MNETPFEPLYARVRRELLARLTSGHWQPGGSLPSETALAAELSVSQGTVRKALDSLTADGVVVRHQGKGTFVAEHTPERSNYHFFRLVDDADVRQIPDPISETRLRCRPSAAAVAALGLVAGEAVWRIDRVRAIADRPALIEQAEVPAALMPDLRGPLPNALYSHYQAVYRISVLRTEDRLQAVLADAEQAATLRVKPGDPLLESTRTAFDLMDRPVEFRRSVFMTDGLRYAVSLR